MRPVRFTVLGPVRIDGPDGELAVPGRLRRGLLGYLLLNAGRVVAVERIVDVLWGGTPPASATAQVRAAVCAIRATLRAAGAAPATLTSSGGYGLMIPPGAVDLDRFAGSVRAARAAATGSRLAEAGEQLVQALALWRGPPLVDASGAYLAGERLALDEQRTRAEEELAEIELALGRHCDVLPRLQALVAAHPLRQRPHGLLMLALYRAGRGPEALARYRELRKRLTDEHGLDPDRDLQELHRACLRRDPCLDPPAPAAQPARLAAVPTGRSAANGSPAGPPRQLPRDIADFTGRADTVDRLNDLLAPPGGRPVPVVSIVGPAGVGKTALAVHVAHLLADRFCDGQLFVDLRGTAGPPVEAGEALSRMLRALGVANVSQPVGLDERASLYRSLLAERRVLVMLDDAASEAQVRPLLPGRSPSAALLTGRRRLRGLEAATVVELDLLRPDEALQLLGRVAGRGRVAAEPAAARALVGYCGHLPLAIRIAGARLASASTSVTDLAGRLSDERRRLAELATGDLDVRTSLGLSYRDLPAPARRALRLLALVHPASVAAWLPAALLAVPQAVAVELLGTLVEAQLLDFAQPDVAGQTRYQLHDLVRLYAGERLEVEESPAGRVAALRRAASAAVVLLTKDDTAGRTGAAWLAAERAILVSLAEQAFAIDSHDIGFKLAAGLRQAARSLAGLPISRDCAGARSKPTAGPRLGQ